jgi:hypothetical protein
MRLVLTAIGASGGGLEGSGGSAAMNWVAMLTGIGGAALLAVGCNMIVPIGSEVGGAFDLAGVASVMVFLGLMDGE